MLKTFRNHTIYYSHKYYVFLQLGYTINNKRSVTLTLVHHGYSCTVNKFICVPTNISLTFRNLEEVSILVGMWTDFMQSISNITRVCMHGMLEYFLQPCNFRLPRSCTTGLIFNVILWNCSNRFCNNALIMYYYCSTNTFFR